MKNRLLAALAAGILIAGCAAGPDQPKPAPLLETYWRAIEIDSQPVKAGSGKRELHLILSSERNSVSGFSGCNSFRGIYDRKFRGTYDRKENDLRFTGLASTLMACPPDESELEKRFLTTLQAADSQRVIGNILELRDVDGKPRARFEARSVQR